MEKTNYKLALQAAMQEQSDLFQERRNIDARLTTLKETIEGLNALIEEKPSEPELPAELFGETGISGAIRFLLQRSNVPLAPIQIRTQLMSHGFDLSDYANATALIHNTLKRLERQGEVLTVKDSSGKAIAYTTVFLSPDFGPKHKRPNYADTLPENARDLVDPSRRKK
jgi:hypothetical protein